MSSIRLESQKQHIPLAAAGKLQRAIASTRGVSERRRIEQAYQSNEARLKALLGSIDEIVFEFDVKGTHLNIWTHNEELLAYPKEERLGRTLEQIYGGEFARPFLEIFARVLQSGQAENIEYPLMVRGSKRWYLGRANPVPAADGMPATVCLLSRDITDRKRAELETRRLALLADNSQSLVAISDLNLQVLFMNPAGRQLVSLTTNGQSPSSKVTDYFVPGDRQKLETDILPRVMGGETWKGELSLSQFNQAQCIPALWHIFRIDDPSNAEPVNLAWIAVDISERKQFEDALRQKRATISRLFHVSRTLNATLDLNVIAKTVISETVSITNSEGGACAIRGAAAFKCEACIHNGSPMTLRFEWPTANGLGEWLVTHKKAYLSNRVSSDLLLSPVLRRKFDTRQILCIPILDACGEVIAFFGIHNKKDPGGYCGADVENMIVIAQVASIAMQNALAYRAMRDAKRELRTLSARLLQSQDQERRRIARELHDQTVQSLAGVHMNLRRMAQMNGKLTPDAHAYVDESLKMMDQSIEELRTLSYVLHPPILDEAGLGAAIEWYAGGFMSRSGIRVRVDLTGDLRRFSPEYEMTIFRVIQECLSNIRRHSCSESAIIRLCYDHDRTVLEVEDRGRGIRKSKKTVSTGVGIAGMRERVRHLGGTFQIVPATPNGTLVRVQLPSEAAVERVS